MASTLEQMLRMGGTSNPQSGERLAGMLRQQNDLGKIMQLSGHSRVAPLGAGLSNEAMRMAETELKRREQRRAQEVASAKFAEQQGYRARQEERADARLMLSAATAQATRQMAQDRMDDKRTERADKRMEDLSDNLVKAKIPGLMDSLNELDAIVAQYGPDGDIPSMGLTGMAPKVSLSDEGKRVRSTVQSLVNDVTNMRFGSAVSQGEAKNLQREILFHLGSMNTDDDLRIGLPIIKQKFDVLRGYIEKPFQEDGTVDKFYSGTGNQPAYKILGGGASAPAQEIDMATFNESDFAGYRGK